MGRSVAGSLLAPNFGLRADPFNRPWQCPMAALWTSCRCSSARRAPCQCPVTPTRCCPSTSAIKHGCCRRAARAAARDEAREMMHRQPDATTTRLVVYAAAQRGAEEDSWWRREHDREGGSTGCLARYKRARRCWSRSATLLILPLFSPDSASRSTWSIIVFVCSRPDRQHDGRRRFHAGRSLAAVIPRFVVAQYFCDHVVLILAQLLFPVSQMHRNSLYYSGTPSAPLAKDHKLPHFHHPHAMLQGRSLGPCWLPV